MLPSLTKLSRKQRNNDRLNIGASQFNYETLQLIAPCLENIGSTVVPNLAVPHERFNANSKSVPAEYPVWKLASFTESENKDLKYFNFFVDQYGSANSSNLLEFDESAFRMGMGKAEFLVADTTYGPMRVCWYTCNVLNRNAFDLKQGVKSEYHATKFLNKVVADKENNTFVCAATIDVFSQATRLYGTTVWKETAALEIPQGTTQMSLRESEILQDMLSRCPFYGIADDVMSPGSQMAQVANTTGMIGGDGWGGD